MVTAPVLGLAAVGVKVTSMVQATSDESAPPPYGQEVAVVTSAKSPLAVMLVRVSWPIAIGVRVTLWFGLVELPGTDPKLRLLGASVTALGGEILAT
jgi:hypothetical protein